MRYRGKNNVQELRSFFLAFLCLFIASCGLFDDDPPSSQPSTPFTGGPTASAVQLGDIQAEERYFQTNGNGTIQVIQDAATPDPCCFADFGPNGRRIRLHPNFSTFPSSVQSFFLAHEHGHHYLRHESQGSQQGFRLEYEADAYAARVIASTQGASVAFNASMHIGSAGSPGDATHPPSIDRANYINQIINAFNSNPSSVPTPPATPVVAQTGILVIRNNINEPGLVYVNASLVGILQSGQSDQLALPPGNYRIDLQGQISLFYYSPAFITLAAGQTIFIP